MEIYLKNVPLQKCSNYYSYEKRFRDEPNNGQLCAADPGFIMDACQVQFKIFYFFKINFNKCFLYFFKGKSGGPLLIHRIKNGKSIPYVIGLNSFGDGCGNGIPSLYTNVSHYLRWIENNVWL